jgi:hypothetical protein
MDILWLDGNPNGTSLAGYLDLPLSMGRDEAIAKLEAAAGEKGDWEYTEDYGHNWWGLVGTFKGKTFTVYTHKGSGIHIGAHDGFLGMHEPEVLDVAGLKAALLALVTGA